MSLLVCFAERRMILKFVSGNGDAQRGFDAYYVEMLYKIAAEAVRSVIIVIYFIIWLYVEQVSFRGTC